MTTNPNGNTATAMTLPCLDASHKANACLGCDGEGGDEDALHAECCEKRRQVARQPEWHLATTAFSQQSCQGTIKSKLARTRASSVQVQGDYRLTSLMLSHK